MAKANGLLVGANVLVAPERNRLKHEEEEEEGEARPGLWLDLGLGSPARLFSFWS